MAKFINLEEFELFIKEYSSKLKEYINKKKDEIDKKFDTYYTKEVVDSIKDELETKIKNSSNSLTSNIEGLCYDIIIAPAEDIDEITECIDEVVYSIYNRIYFPKFDKQRTGYYAITTSLDLENCSIFGDNEFTEILGDGGIINLGNNTSMSNLIYTGVVAVNGSNITIENISGNPTLNVTGLHPENVLIKNCGPSEIYGFNWKNIIVEKSIFKNGLSVDPTTMSDSFVIDGCVAGADVHIKNVDTVVICNSNFESSVTIENCNTVQFLNNTISSENLIIKNVINININENSFNDSSNLEIVNSSDNTILSLNITGNSGLRQPIYTDINDNDKLWNNTIGGISLSEIPNIENLKKLGSNILDNEIVIFSQNNELKILSKLDNELVVSGMLTAEEVTTLDIDNLFK